MHSEEPLVNWAFVIIYKRYEIARGVPHRHVPRKRDVLLWFYMIFNTNPRLSSKRFDRLPCRFGFIVIGDNDRVLKKAFYFLLFQLAQQSSEQFRPSVRANAHGYVILFKH